MRFSLARSFVVLIPSLSPLYQGCGLDWIPFASEWVDGMRLKGFALGLGGWEWALLLVGGIWRRLYGLGETASVELRLYGCNRQLLNMICDALH